MSADWLHDLPDAGRASTIMLRLGWKREISVWGLQFQAPRHMQSSHFWRWGLRRGDYEKHEVQALTRVLDPSLPVVEFGAGIGVVSCVANRMLDDPSRHVVYEMDPRLLPVIKGNRDRNGARFQVEHGALWYDDDAPSFDMHPTGFLGQHAAAGAGTLVPPVTLREACREFGDQRVNLVMDVEGAEMAMLREDADAVRRHVGTVVMEVHPETQTKAAAIEAVHALEEAGMTCTFLVKDVLGARRA